MSKNEIASEASLPPDLVGAPSGTEGAATTPDGVYNALRAALRGNRPKAVKEAILGEMRRREAQESRESLSYNGGMNEADV